MVLKTNKIRKPIRPKGVETNASAKPLILISDLLVHKGDRCMALPCRSGDRCPVDHVCTHGQRDSDGSDNGRTIMP